MTVMYTIRKPLVQETLDILHAAGQCNREGVVVWFAPRSARRVISVVLVPIHEASDDYFHITPEGNKQLREICQRDKLVLEAQVHTHPRRAFHSRADDKFAVVRHEDALSIVLPNFALKTTTVNFLADSATYILDSDDRWRRLALPRLREILNITE